MLPRAALITPNLGSPENYSSRWKQALLLFDVIGQPLIEEMIQKLLIHTNQQYQNFGIEINSLYEKGFAINIYPRLDEIPDQDEASRILAAINNLDTDSKVERYDYLVRYMSRANNLLPNRKAETCALVQNLALPQSHGIVKDDVYSLIVTNFPTISNKTHWQKIIEFKDDPESKGALLGLRHWMNSSLKSGKSIEELNDEIEFLVYQYKKALELHSIEHETGILQSIAFISLEVLQNTFSGRWTDIIKPFFKAQQKRIQLLRSELTATGHEIAYIVKVNEAFK